MTPQPFSSATPSSRLRRAPHWIRWTATAGAAVTLLGGCSVLQEDKIDYKSARPVQTLEVPPDLTQLNRESRYALPAGDVVSANSQTVIQQPTAPAVTAANTVSDVRIERAGTQRWLVVDRAPEKLWSPVRDFWQESGFVFTLDQENLGLLETDWAENRAKLPQDIIRSTIGKVFDSLYSTGERDKFRTRLERNANGGTEIYISHRGMVEVYTNDKKEQTVWQPRPVDPELEAEFLRRLMVKLGLSQEQSKALLASTPVPQQARLVTVQQQPLLQLNDGFDRAWRRVGLALDRTGFTVEDRNRAEGTYFVRYVPSNAVSEADKPGFFSRLFSGSTVPDATPTRYRVLVRNDSAQTTVSVLNQAGQPETSDNAQRILQLLADDLK